MSSRPSSPEPPDRDSAQDSSRPGSRG
jgi:hypothetical protein